MKKIVILTSLISAVFVFWSCNNTGPSDPGPDDFDREAILANWADSIIIPAFSVFSQTTANLRAAGSAFAEHPDLQALDNLRQSWRDAYLAFQHVSMFEMKKPMEIRFRENLNIYPADTTEIQENIEGGVYNLELPSLANSQGFPALDYLLHGLSENDAEILARYTIGDHAENYRTYVADLTVRIDELTNQALNDWNGGYRNTFVGNSGSGANSSLDMMVNDFIYYYEKHLRAGKIGIAAGVFSGTPLAGHVEAYYSEGFSKALFNEALAAVQNFFNGTHFENGRDGASLDDYLDYLNTMKDGADLTALINNQFDAAAEAAEALDDDFAAQVEADHSRMLSVYDELQKNVVNMKVDMLQALNISVDYVDADGD